MSCLFLLLCPTLQFRSSEDTPASLHELHRVIRLGPSQSQVFVSRRGEGNLGTRSLTNIVIMATTIAGNIPGMALPSALAIMKAMAC